MIRSIFVCHQFSFGGVFKLFLATAAECIAGRVFREPFFKIVIVNPFIPKALKIPGLFLFRWGRVLFTHYTEKIYHHQAVSYMHYQ